jgi:hypothetical protein
VVPVGSLPGTTASLCYLLLLNLLACQLFGPFTIVNILFFSGSWVPTEAAVSITSSHILNPHHFCCWWWQSHAALYYLLPVPVPGTHQVLESSKTWKSTNLHYWWFLISAKHIDDRSLLASYASFYLKPFCTFFRHPRAQWCYGDKTGSQCFRSGSALDPHSIGFLDPDPEGVKSAKSEGKHKAKRQKIHHKELN